MQSSCCVSRALRATEGDAVMNQPQAAYSWLCSALSPAPIISYEGVKTSQGGEMVRFENFSPHCCFESDTTASVQHLPINKIFWRCKLTIRLGNPLGQTSFHIRIDGVACVRCVYVLIQGHGASDTSPHHRPSLQSAQHRNQT